MPPQRLGARGIVAFGGESFVPVQCGKLNKQMYGGGSMMIDAMIAIVLLAFANFLIAWARQRRKGWLRHVLSVVAFLLLIPALMFGLRALL
ncbi:MAG: DUF2768 family protein [Planifilum sp.]